ncbi:phosphocarrier protein HPr [Arthrobacter sp. MP_M7]|nr:phosphocarrier protein HPr [Arthrobacter sp. MP_M4]MEC5202929.1 phosphocarrier protein HPr [Arthrobacter sp. MP_M7]
MSDPGLDHGALLVRLGHRPRLGLNPRSSPVDTPLRDKELPLRVRTAIVQAPVGLHARPAALFVRAVQATGLPVIIRKAGRPGVDARSLLEVMTEDFSCGCKVELAVPPGAESDRVGPAGVDDALDALTALLESSGGS